MPRPREITRARVLVVEDDGDIRAEVADLLRDEGYDVDVAGNGREAIQILDGSLLPDLILLDLMMPVMDGHAFLQAKREHPRWGRVPVIVMTAHIVHSQPDAAALLNKPFDTAHLLEIVAKHTGT